MYSCCPAHKDCQSTLYPTIKNLLNNDHYFTYLAFVNVPSVSFEELGAWPVVIDQLGYPAKRTNSQQLIYDCSVTL